MSEADNFFKALKSNPEEILEWCDGEIAEYERLKRIIKREIKKEVKE